MRIHAARIWVFLILGWAPSSASGADGGSSSKHGGLPGRAAPAFLLPRLAGGDQVLSDTLYSAAGVSLVVFWTTHCAECTRRLERCQALLDWGADSGLQVVAVNFDEIPGGKALMVARRAAPQVLHLYDPGGRTAAAFRAGAHSFSAYAVDAHGVIRSIHHEIPAAQIITLRPELSALVEEAFADELSPGAPKGDHPAPGRAGRVSAGQRIQLRGRGRLRWMDIDTTGTGAVGANGEMLPPGKSLYHRMDLELGYQITPQLQVGGLIRIGNEGAAVLRSGPDYLANERGSLFIRHQTSGRLPLLGSFRSALTGGLYRVHLTPLTLMRWDADDTPVSGGQRAQGCGVCGGDAGAAGFIRSESLEKLGPDLSFEGARWDAGLRERLDLTLLYARPQTPWPDDPADYCDPGIDPSATFFHQDLYAARAVSHWGLPWGASPLDIAGTAVLIREDENNPASTCMRQAYDVSLAGADIVLPLPGRLTATGELTASRASPDKQNAPESRRNGSAFQVGLAGEHQAAPGQTLLGLSLQGLRVRLAGAYQSISRNFFSPYSALSYENNLHGIRGSLRIDVGRWGLGGFYKRHTPLQSVKSPGGETSGNNHKTTAGVWIDAALWPGGVLLLGEVYEKRTIYHRQPVDGKLGPLERRVLVAGCRQELAPRCQLLAEAEWLEGDWRESDRGREAIREYSSSIVRLMMEVEF